MNDKRVERLWRREGLKVPMKQAARGRLWFNDGSCILLKPEYKNHVWSYDFVHHRTDDGKAFRALNILDEFSRECLEIRVKRKLNSTDVVDALTDLFILRGMPRPLLFLCLSFSVQALTQRLTWLGTAVVQGSGSTPNRPVRPGSTFIGIRRTGELWEG